MGYVEVAQRAPPGGPGRVDWHSIVGQFNSPWIQKSAAELPHRGEAHEERNMEIMIDFIADNDRLYFLYISVSRT